LPVQRFSTNYRSFTSMNQENFQRPFRSVYNANKKRSIKTKLASIFENNKNQTKEKEANWMFATEVQPEDHEPEMPEPRELP
jgi:hypothetical protein